MQVFATPMKMHLVIEHEEALQVLDLDNGAIVGYEYGGGYRDNSCSLSIRYSSARMTRYDLTKTYQPKHAKKENEA